MKLKYANAKTNPPKPKTNDPSTPATPDQGPKDSRKIHVNGIPIEWTNDNIRAYFEKFVHGWIEGV